MIDQEIDCEASTSGNDFNLGDEVHVKSYGRAVIVKLRCAEPHYIGKFDNRIQVQYADGKTYWAQPSNLRKVVKPAKRIITAETTRQYREACLRYVNPNDICLEVGCHEGVTTAMVQRKCKTIVGVDLSDVTIQIARQKFPQVRFEVVSGDNVEVLKGLSPTGEYDKIMLDIGGIAELPAVMHLVGLYYRTWKNSTLIIKSVFFSRLLEDTEVYKPLEASVSKAAINAAAERKKRREQESSVEQPSV